VAALRPGLAGLSLVRSADVLQVTGAIDGAGRELAYE
jgi:hypothetical protein